MLSLQPVTGWLVAQDRARAVVAPPYDALDPAARATVAASDPDSYLGALPSGDGARPGAADADLDAVLARCRSHLDHLLAAGRFRPLPDPSLVVLTLGAGAERATAVIGDVEVGAFTDGRVLPHERIRDDRADALARYLEVVGVASSPVALTHRPHAEVTAATDEVLAGAPADLAYRADPDVSAPEGIDVAAWIVRDPAVAARLTDALAATGPAFVADGHHRAAAAARYAARIGATPADPAGRVLCAVLPSDHLDVRPFHRRVEGVGHLDVEEVVAGLRARGLAVTVVDAAPTAAERPAGVVHLVVRGRWLRVDARDRRREDDPVEALDVRLAEREVLPVLLADTNDAAPERSRVVPVADPVGLAALDRPGAIGIALHPPDIDAVLAIASAGRTVPAKTTYVVPKLRSGLLVTPRGPHAPHGAAYA